MGTGKSTWVINHVIQSHPKKFVVVVPILPEVIRYEDAIGQHRAVYAPHVDEGSPDIDTKLKAFKRAVQEGTGVIVTTHALFSLWEDESRQHIAEGGYTLILDETVEPVKEADIKKDDYQLLLQSGYIKEEPCATGKANFKSISSTEITAEYDGKLKGFIRQALRNNVICIYDSKYIQTIKPENITAFEQCFVLTYMYPGSQMDCWFRLYGLDVAHKTLVRDSEDGELILSEHSGQYSGAEFADKITLIETPAMNDVGKQGRRGVPLSNNWFKKVTAEQLRKIQNNLSNVARHLTRKHARDVLGDDGTHPGFYFMWSAKNGQREILEKGMPYKMVPAGATVPNEDADRECFLAHNQRATNRYAHKACLAYLTTPLPIVPIKQFFTGHGLDYNDETFMLSTLLQWVWRSRIRNGLEILIYIPSEPLRMLFCKWVGVTM